MSVEAVRVSAAWLALREPADAAARAEPLVELVRSALAGAGPEIVVHDLGAGTGSMLRWLAPRLAGRQHWILHDRDADLLSHALTSPVASLDGSPVTAEARPHDIAQLPDETFDGASLVTAAALLDLLTAGAVHRIVAMCARAGAAALMTTTVVGRVEVSPPDPLDGPIGAAFNDHQRRSVGGRRLLGPDAVAVTAAAFRAAGARVAVRPSPWRLGAGQRELMLEWLDGWLAAAVEQRPELAGSIVEYAARRRAEADAGELAVSVHHRDLLAARKPRTRGDCHS